MGSVWKISEIKIKRACGNATIPHFNSEERILIIARFNKVTDDYQKNQ